MTSLAVGGFLAVFFCTRVFSQDSVKIKKLKILPVPAFGYSPETKTYIGAVTLFTFNRFTDSVTRTSNAKFEINYTWNKQLILEAGWNYFFKEEKWFTKGLIHYSHYPDFYYGIGSNTPDENKALFTANRFVADIYALKKIHKNLFSGLNLKYTDYSGVKPGNNTISYPELISSSTFGIGYSLVFDSRNNILTPASGYYFNFNTSYNFSKTNYLKTTFDLRYYKTWKEKLTFSARFINELNTGTPPFYDNAFLGGDKFVRGYYFGRYRDKNLSSLQSEFRFPIVWRFGLAAFGGLSTLYANANSIEAKNVKPNYGLGLRFLVDKKDKTNLRLDYAAGKDGNDGFYVSFGESF